MTAPAALIAVPKPRERDLRLDLARGLTMLIIFVAHVPDNRWADFIPARMGFSSGAEAFVLCSGLASGVAFGGVFRRRGLVAGTTRIGRRVMQLAAMQIIAFAAFAALMLGIDAMLGGGLYQTRYNLGAVAAQPIETMFAVATLQLVPLFFDILPLYIVLLAAVPLLVVVARWSPPLVLALSGLLWLVVQVLSVVAPTHPVADPGWYFNPFAWQFLFFIGFGVTSGWVPTPAPTRTNLAFALGIIVISFFITFWGAHAIWPMLGEFYVAIYPDHAISRLHPLRLLHVLALGWLFAMLLRNHGAALARPVCAPFIMVGQQALSTFIAGIFLSALAGVVLDQLGHGPWLVAVVNLAGMAVLLLVARVARHLKSTPAAIQKPSLPATSSPSAPKPKAPQACPDPA
jgi:hypothetical protein